MRGEGDHLRGQEIDQQGHEQALALDLFGVALAQDLFKEDALVGDVLVDDPEAFVVDGEDEGVAQLAEGLEGGERAEGGLFDDAAVVAVISVSISAVGRSRWRWSGRRRRGARARGRLGSGESEKGSAWVWSGSASDCGRMRWARRRVARGRRAGG